MQFQGTSTCWFHLPSAWPLSGDSLSSLCQPKPSLVGERDNCVAGRELKGRGCPRGADSSRPSLTTAGKVAFSWPVLFSPLPALMPICRGKVSVSRLRRVISLAASRPPTSYQRVAGGERPPRLNRAKVRDPYEEPASSSWPGFKSSGSHSTAPLPPTDAGFPALPCLHLQPMPLSSRPSQRLQDLQ